MPLDKPPIFAVLVAQVFQKTEFAPNTDVDEVLGRWIANLSVAVDQYGAHLIRSVGSMLRCAFDRADHAVQCACALQDAVSKASVAISLRVGLDVGTVKFENDDYACETATQAAILAGQAQRGRIALSDTVFEQLSSDMQEAVSAGSVGGASESAYEIDWRAVELPEFPLDIGPGGSTVENSVTVQHARTRKSVDIDIDEDEFVIAAQDDRHLTIPLAHLREQVRKKAGPRRLALATAPPIPASTAPTGSGPRSAESSRTTAGRGAGQTQVIGRSEESLCVALEGQVTVLDQMHPRATIGRVPGNDIVCNVDSTSRKHAEIALRQDEWFLIDYSRNGTLVYCADEGREDLAHGGEVKLGKCGAISLGCQFDENLRALFFWVGHPTTPPPLLHAYLEQ